MTMICSTDECDGTAHFWVTSPQGVQRLACSDCAQGLTAMGFTNEGPIKARDRTHDEEETE